MFGVPQTGRRPVRSLANYSYRVVGARNPVWTVRGGGVLKTRNSRNKKNQWEKIFPPVCDMHHTIIL